MPTNTYTALATITLTGTDSTIDFASIPGTYRDLIIVGNNFGTADTGDAIMRFNSDTGANYSRVIMAGLSDNSSISVANSSQTSMSMFFPRTQVGSFILQIMDYSATDKHKTVLSRANTASYAAFAAAGRWANTAAITSISLAPASGSFQVGSVISLYGIAS